MHNEHVLSLKWLLFPAAILPLTDKGFPGAAATSDVLLVYMLQQQGAISSRWSVKESNSGLTGNEN